MIYLFAEWFADKHIPKDEGYTYYHNGMAVLGRVATDKSKPTRSFRNLNSKEETIIQTKNMQRYYDRQEQDNNVYFVLL